MSAIIFIVETLLSLALFVVLARLLLQWTRADFRNPLCQAIVRLTNPLILPLRRILPPVRKVDTASVVAVVIVAFVEVAIIFALHGVTFPGPLIWVRMVALEISRTLLWTYFAHAIGAGDGLRARVASVSTADPRRRGPRSLAALGRHRHSGHPHPPALK